jgi:hypothetical protein
MLYAERKTANYRLKLTAALPKILRPRSLAGVLCAEKGSFKTTGDE